MVSNHKNYPVSIGEVIRARTIVSRYLTETALTPYDGLSRLLSADVYVKHENHNPTGTFKVRGGINLMHHLKHSATSGVITFSTGNHGISVALAAKLFGLEAVIVVPENNNPAKNRKIEEQGAELIEGGSSFEEASQVVEKLSDERELYYVHPANEPHLINGVGSEFLEVIEKLPDIDAIIVPIGAGSEAAAAVTTLKSLKDSIDIYAVQAQRSPAAYNSWKAGEIRHAENRTFAGGFATGTGYDLPFSIYKDALTDFVLVSEQEIYEGIALAAYYTQNLLEGAGASTLMAALRLKERLKGKKVVLQFSGCNASADEILKAYGLQAFREGRCH